MLLWFYAWIAFVLFPIFLALVGRMKWYVFLVWEGIALLPITLIVLLIVLLVRRSRGKVVENGQKRKFNGRLHIPAIDKDGVEYIVGRRRK